MNLPDALLEQVKHRAAETGETVTSVMEQALRQLLSQPLRRAQVHPLPTFGQGGAQPLVDLADRDAVWAALQARP